MKLTGERPLEGSTPDSLLALHEAGYREMAARLGTGTVIDLGCGTGEATGRLLGPGRRLIGVDYHPPTAIAAQRAAMASGTDTRFAAMDGARLGFRDASVDNVCSSHLIEHFEAPERHVAEIARVLTDGGTALVITPNAAMDFENPFHVYPFDAAQLASLLRLFFASVTVLGIAGSEELKADFARRRASGARLLRLDPFNLRKRIPRSWYVLGYERLLPFVYRAIGSARSGVGSNIDETHLHTTEKIDNTTIALFAMARQPRRPLR